MDIQAIELCKSFDGRAVLRDVNFRIRAGERWRVQGASGIGKTTLLRLLMGLETPDSGLLTGLAHIRITACFQEQRLCDWLTARQNVRLVCDSTTSDQEIAEVLRALLPEDALDRAAGTLSGGTQRRVALARALLPESDLILLDEPFAGLDAENTDRAADLMERYRRGRALVLVSHEDHVSVDHYQTLRL